jgi:heme-degrading monooxygenase HmoA
VFARLHRLETTREQYELGLEILREEFLPWARDASGFCGVVGLADETREHVLILSLWSDRESLEASAAAGDRLSRIASAGTGSRRQSLESFEVTVFELVPRDAGDQPGGE